MLRLLAGLLFIFSVAIHFQALENSFVYDDALIIRDNPLVQGPLNVGEIFATNYWSATAERDPLYRPLTILSFALQRGAEPLTSKAVMAGNLLLHGCCTLLLFGLVLRLVRSPRIALVSALVFACMPIHVEVVANGVGRAELLAAFFSLLAIHAYFAYLRGLSLSGEVVACREWLGIAALLSSSILALLSKESAVMTPFLIVFLDQLLLVRGSFAARFRAVPLYVILVLPVLTYLALRNVVVGLATPSPHELLRGLDVSERVGLSLRTLVQYIQQAIIPSSFAADYHDYRILNYDGLFTERNSLALIALLLLFVASVIAAVEGQLLPLLGFGWFLLTILPTSNLLVAIGTMRADRLMYFPSAGICIGIGWIFAFGLSCAPRLASIALAAYLVVFSTATIAQVRTWRGKRVLWEHTLTVNPGSADAWRNLGDVRIAKGLVTEGIAAYTQAKQLRAAHGIFDRAATLLLAKTFQASGARDKAIEAHIEVLKRDPNHFVSALSLGQLYLEDASTYEDALRVFRFAASKHPKNPHAVAHEAEALKRLGRLDEALLRIEHCLEMGGTWRYVYDIKAAILDAQGQTAKAEEVRRLAPSAADRSK